MVMWWNMVIFILLQTRFLQFWETMQVQGRACAEQDNFLSICLLLLLLSLFVCWPQPGFSENTSGGAQGWIIPDFQHTKADCVLPLLRLPLVQFIIKINIQFLSLYFYSKHVFVRYVYKSQLIKWLLWWSTWGFRINGKPQNQRPSHNSYECHWMYKFSSKIFSSDWLITEYNIFNLINFHFNIKPVTLFPLSV